MKKYKYRFYRKIEKFGEFMKDNLIETIANQIVRDSANKIDKTIIKFCEKQGFKTIREPKDLIEIQDELAKEDKMVRCEVFYRNIERKNQNSIGIVQVVIPFIDSISQPLSRNDIQKMFKLKDWY